MCDGVQGRPGSEIPTRSILEAEGTPEMIRTIIQPDEIYVCQSGSKAGVSREGIKASNEKHSISFMVDGLRIQSGKDNI